MRNSNNIHSEIIKAIKIPALENDPIKIVLHVVQIPGQFLNDFLTALKIEAEATGKTTNCQRRNCRQSGRCNATHFNGIDHPSGIKWQMETLRTIMMMQTYQLDKAGMEIDHLNILTQLKAH